MCIYIYICRHICMYIYICIYTLVLVALLLLWLFSWSLLLSWRTPESHPQFERLFVCVCVCYNYVPNNMPEGGLLVFGFRLTKSVSHPPSRGGIPPLCRWASLDCKKVCYNYVFYYVLCMCYYVRLDPTLNSCLCIRMFLCACLMLVIYDGFFICCGRAPDPTLNSREAA